MASKNDFMYPSSLGEVGTNDWIEFNAYSNGVAGYTKVQTNTKSRAQIQRNQTSVTQGTNTGAAQSGVYSGMGEGQGTGNYAQTGNLSHEGCAMLYIPEKLSMQSKSNFEGTSGGTATSLASNRLDNTDTDGSFLGIGTSSFLSNVLGGGKDLVLSATEQVEALQVGQQAIGGGVGSANRHVLFKGVEFRTFSYAYQFLPKSQEESIMIRDMIRWFRSQMLPSLTVSGNKFHTPNYFEIKYMIDGNPTEFLNKIKPAVCTTCDVEYGGEGQFAMLQADNFADSAPAVVGLNLEFQEVQLVTKTDALEGY